MNPSRLSPAFPAVLLCLFTLTLFTAPRALAAAADAADTGSPWPAIEREHKPWTRWWWPGSGVDKTSLTRQLEQFAAAGLGGVEITPIYGAKGYEDRSIPYLSPQWMEMLEHVGREAQRLGLGVDMATGTGWPFGGPWIDEAHALSRATLKDGQLAGEPTRMMVKRAAPGGEGLVVDPFSTEALRRYLAPFDRAFASFPRDLVRGQFHDSFEYFGANYTARLPERFREMHGYDLQPFAAALTARDATRVTTVDRDTLARIKADYRETLGQLHVEFLRAWIAWSHERGFIVRNQSHGAPANVFDLYAAVDVPETEIFGSTPFPIPGLRRHASEIRSGNDQDLPEPLVVRMASSAAHVAGHRLASSESATWLRDHWKESLAYVKPELDRILVDGINHIFYHGSVFSPQDAAWPGWLFYASTQFQPNNTWWDDFSALNRYVARVQSLLQAGQPDNDILLYWPYADLLDDPDGLAKMLTVHHVNWLTEQPVGKLARTLQERGFSFDYLSDAFLAQTRSENGALITPGARYKVLVVPATRRMPVATLQKLADLARAGAKIVFEKLPEDVPGYGHLETRRADFQRILTTLGDHPLINADVIAALMPLVPREALADAGLNFIRRLSAPGAHDYFVANLTAKAFDGWVKLAAPAARVTILDPLSGRHGHAATGPQGIYLQLAPGESLLLRATAAPATTLSVVTVTVSASTAASASASAAASASTAWPYRQPAGAPIVLTGEWSLTFLKGGPSLPPPLTTTALKSWTELGGEEAQRFGGTARYRLEFDAPASSSANVTDWLLALGDVRESARVRLNGRDVATAWSLPFHVRVGEFLQPGRNVLELDVTNLAANRIRYLDQQKTPWKIMREINFVNIDYKPFDASGWALTPSGLLGPVTLTPLSTVALPR